MSKRMKRGLVCALVAALTMTSASSIAFAATGSPTEAPEPVAKKDVTVKTENGVKVEVDTKKDGTATLETVKKTSKKSVTVASTVTVNGVSYKVTTVDAKAFANCKKATKVTLPKTIKTIKKGAFTGAKKLKTIKINTKKSITVKKGAFKGLKTTKMTVTVSKNMSKKELKKFQKVLKKAGFKGKVKKAS